MDVEKKTEADVSVPRTHKVSKTQAVKLLRWRFRSARIMNVTTDVDTARGVERWQVWCLSDYARQTSVVEVAGEREHLPKAALVAAYRRINHNVIFGEERGKQTVTIRAVPLKIDPPPQNQPVTTEPK